LKRSLHVPKLGFEKSLDYNLLTSAAEPETFLLIVVEPEPYRQTDPAQFPALIQYIQIKK
jgi:hypothetical protein